MKKTQVFSAEEIIADTALEAERKAREFFNLYGKAERAVRASDNTIIYVTVELYPDRVWVNLEAADDRYVTSHIHNAIEALERGLCYAG